MRSQRDPRAAVTVVVPVWGHDVDAFPNEAREVRARAGAARRTPGRTRTPA